MATALEKKMSPDYVRWRLDPEESFSDWTIEVTRKEIDGKDAKDEENVIESYHVHKTFLGAGKRKSTYFERIFNSGEMKESHDNTTRIGLEKFAADAFPAFLDFLYGCDLKATTETFVALRHLMDYFGVSSSAGPMPTHFMKKDLSLQNVHIYCQEAIHYKDQYVTDKCIEVASKAPCDLLTQSVDKSKAKPVQLMMKMLTDAQQAKLFKAALENSMTEMDGFRRLPMIEDTFHPGRYPNGRIIHTNDYFGQDPPPNLVGMPTIKNYTKSGSVYKYNGKNYPLFYFADSKSNNQGSGRSSLP